MKQRLLLVFLIVAVFLLSACAEPTSTPILTSRRARTQHLNITFPDGQESQIQNFLVYAEDVYADVNEMFAGALPPKIDVALVIDDVTPFPDPDIVLRLENPDQVEQTYAAELVRLIYRESLADRNLPQCCGFFYEGLAAWVEERYEWKHGPAEPRPLRAAYGYTQGWADLSQLEQWDQMLQRVEPHIATAIAYTFVSHFISVYGNDGLLQLLDEMSRNTSVCYALDVGGFDCAAFVQSWQTLLGLEASSDDFIDLPRISAALDTQSEGQVRDANIVVQIVNPEDVGYQYCLSYTVGADSTQDCQTAANRYLTSRTPLGQLPAGTSVKWRAAIWSETLQAWIITGPFEQTIP